MSESRDLKRARGLYESFREEPVRRVRRARLAPSKAVAQIGIVEFVGYLTTHGGRSKLYIHEFAPGSRPKMYASGRRGELYLFGGRFTVTDRGITDLDERGRAIDAAPRYKVVLRRPRT